MWLSMLAGAERLLPQRQEEPRREDFRISAFGAWGLFFFYVIWVRHPEDFSHLGNDAGSVREVVSLLALALRRLSTALSIAVVGSCIIEAATTVFVQMTSRRVGWWSRLPENGAAGDVKPIWSKSLAGCVIVMPVVLLFRVPWPSPSSCLVAAT